MEEINNGVIIAWTRLVNSGTSLKTYNYPISFSVVACINSKINFSQSADLDNNHWYCEFIDINLTNSYYKTNIPNSYALYITIIGY